jgi:hypothetical protein
LYDFGDSWYHTVTLEKVLDTDPTLTHPRCVAGKGDAPVEHWNPEDPEEPVPFDIDDINKRLQST